MDPDGLEALGQPGVGRPSSPAAGSAARRGLERPARFGNASRR